MEINGQSADNVLEQKFKELMETANNITPEMEAEFEEKERQRLHQEGLSRIVRSNDYAEIPKRFWDCTFNKYPSEVSEEVRELCLKEDSDAILLLCGTTGRGKTTTLSCALHERAYNGLDAGLYFSIRNLEMELRRCRTFGAAEDEKTWMRRLSMTPLLCLDEVGTCPNKAEEIAFEVNLLSARYDNCLRTFIATNYTPIEFKAHLCNVNIEGKTDQELRELSAYLDKNVIIMNRIKSVAVVKTLVGESHRGAANGNIQ